MRIWVAIVLSIMFACNVPKERKPNIVIFYVDDLGYGDVSCYGAKRITTPAVDRLAMGGVRFTDGHCSASTCTPSRYALLTGRYAFRNKAAILPGDAPLLIDTATLTLPRMLQRAGYRTGVVGKWHLGLGSGNVDWNKHISPGAKEIGFDYSFLIPATGDRVPTVFVENGDVVGLEADDPIQVSYSSPLPVDNAGEIRMKADAQHSNTIINGVGRIGYMTGGRNATWNDEQFPKVFTAKAESFINNNDDRPFFLFYSFHDIHVPRIINPDFAGKSALGTRGDAIAQMDWAVGQIMEMLSSAGKLDNTLVIFTSDNGPVLDDGYDDLAVELNGDHTPSGIFRGGKYSAFEAGTRVPTIAYWNNHIKPTVSKALVSQVDLLASLAALAGVDISNKQMDSENYLDTWTGADVTGRTQMLEESFTLSVRHEEWKYIRPFTGQTFDWLANKKIEGGLSARPQLFNLADDPGELTDLSEKYPGKVTELDSLITEIQNKKN